MTYERMKEWVDENRRVECTPSEGLSTSGFIAPAKTGIDRLQDQIDDLRRQIRELQQPKPWGPYLPSNPWPHPYPDYGPYSPACPPWDSYVVYSRIGPNVCIY